jgi:hypothetical protein
VGKIFFLTSLHQDLFGSRLIFRGAGEISATPYPYAEHWRGPDIVRLSIEISMSHVLYFLPVPSNSQAPRVPPSDPSHRRAATCQFRRTLRVPKQTAL